VAQEIAASSASFDPLGLGAVTSDQLVPSQCSARGVPPVEVTTSPTAEQSVAVAHDTAPKTLTVAPVGLGEVTIDQVVPFQCSINGLISNADAVI